MASLLKTVTTFVLANKSSVATGVAVAGVIFTAVTAGKAALDAKEVLVSLDEGATKTEKAKALAPKVLPVVFVGGSTIALMIFAHRTDLKAQGALVSALALSEASKNEQVHKLIEKLDPKEVDEAKKEYAIEKLAEKDREDAILDYGGDTLIYDPFLDRAMYCDQAVIKAAFGQIGLDMAETPWVNQRDFTLNDLYDYIYENSPNAKDRFKEMGAARMFGWTVGFNTPYVSLTDCGLYEGRPAIYLDYTYDFLRNVD